jgi:hypothetical protein
LGEYLDLLREGVIKPTLTGPWLVGGVIYFKADHAFKYIQDAPVSQWQRKELGSICRQIGLVYVSNDSCIRHQGIKVKNVWGVKQGR